uniref:glutamine--tRNA ligase n=1 Tax=Ditylenchus dipsaci TaxID=166011 RepID=A0A915EDC4_9BILA
MWEELKQAIRLSDRRFSYTSWTRYKELRNSFYSLKKSSCYAGYISCADWDDPRLFTLPALRRRGIPAEAVNAFVAKLGLTVAQTAIQPSMLDSVVRDYLNTTAPEQDLLSKVSSRARIMTMAVLEPLKVHIDNYLSLGLSDSLETPHFPANPECKNTYRIAFGQTIYIEREDFRPDGEKGYRRLTNNQPVGLKHIGLVLQVKNIQKDSDGVVDSIVATVEKLVDSNIKPKAFIHWVAEPVNCEVRLYEPLFKHKNPEDATAVPDGFLSDCNSNTLKVLPHALIDASVADAKIYDRFQFERTGYFCVDKDSSKQRLVFNRTVLLKEDSGKN